MLLSKNRRLPDPHPTVFDGGLPLGFRPKGRDLPVRSNNILKSIDKMIDKENVIDK